MRGKGNLAAQKKASSFKGLRKYLRGALQLLAPEMAIVVERKALASS